MGRMKIRLWVVSTECNVQMMHYRTVDLKHVTNQCYPNIHNFLKMYIHKSQFLGKEETIPGGRRCGTRRDLGERYIYIYL